MTRDAKRRQTPSKPLGFTLSPTLLYALIALAGFFVGGTASLNAYNRYASAKEARTQAWEEAERLRAMAQVVAALRQEVAALEARFQSIRWPDPPERGGAVWLAQELARREWTLKQVLVGKAEPAGEVTNFPVTVAVERMDYAAFTAGLESVRERQVRPRGLKLTADAKGDLSGQVVFGFMIPSSPPKVPGDSPAAPNDGKEEGGQ